VGRAAVASDMVLAGFPFYEPHSRKSAFRDCTTAPFHFSKISNDTLEDSVAAQCDSSRRRTTNAATYPPIKRGAHSTSDQCEFGVRNEQREARAVRSNMLCMGWASGQVSGVALVVALMEPTCPERYDRCAVASRR